MNKCGTTTTIETYVQDLTHLYGSESYFLSLPARKTRSDYHQISIDPDGVARNSLLEEQGWILNNQELLRLINESNCLQSGAKILDFGCGPGFLLSSLSNNVHKFGVDSSAKALEMIKREEIISSNSLETFVDVEFDLIIVNHVIEHLPKPVEKIEELISMLKSGGEFIIGTPDFGSAMAHHFKDNYRMLHEPSHISLFTLDSLLRLLRDLGLQILKVKFPFFDSPYFTRDNLLKILDTGNVSPPFWGNFLLIKCKKL